MLGCAGALTGVEAWLLEVRSGFFTSGYGGAYASGALETLGFVAGSLALDAGLVVALWALCLPLLGVFRVGPWSRFLLAGLVGAGVPLVLDFARYAVEAVLGRAASLAVLWELSGGSVLEMWAQSVDQVPVGTWLLALGVSGLAVTIPLGRALERRLPGAEHHLTPPRARTLWLGVGLLAAVGMLLIGPRQPALDAVRFAWAKKPSTMALRGAVEGLTDFDGDGAGWLAQPPDPAPFDASVHRYAIDVPGNGVDENRLAGDHPAELALDAPLPVEARAAATLPAARPSVLFVLLESFRADLIGQRREGRAITPFLNALARQGASSSRAFAHTPHTFASRAQLFGGTLAPEPAQPSMIDDFAELGYEVAHFSGQDDSFAGSDRYMHVERADVFYDARQDRVARSGRGTSSGALQVSWKTLLGRIEAFLAARDPERPLFLYVNVVDTHFPFAHPDMDDLLGVEPVTRSEIRVRNQDRVRATYANAAANVDRAVERLVAMLRDHVSGEPAIVVTADHGEALYEDGFLGHGQALDDAQTRIPLILSGIGGEWPEPLGLADLRGLLRHNLLAGRDGAAPPSPRLVPDPERRVFQFVSRLDRPRRIALRGLEDAQTYDFLAPTAMTPDLHRLVWTWEAWAAHIPRDLP